MKNDEEDKFCADFPDNSSVYETVGKEKEVKIEETKKVKQPIKLLSSDTKTTQCPECPAVFTFKQAMVRHYRSKHEGIKYLCSQCDYQAPRMDSLQDHIQAKHGGVKYPCNQCDYEATAKGNLLNHIQSQHEGIRHLNKIQTK